MINVIWITGGYFARAEIKSQLKETVKDYDLYVYEEGNNADTIAEAISTDEIFSKAKIVILRVLPSFSKDAIPKTLGKKDCRRYEEMFSNLPDGCYVIVDGIRKSYASSLYKLVEETGHVYVFPNSLPFNDAISYVIEQLEKEGLKVEYDVGKLFVKRIGGSGKNIDIDKLYLAMQAVLSYTQGEKKLTTLQVLDVVKVTGEISIWELFNAIDDRDFRLSQKIVHRMYEESGNLDNTINYLLYMLPWRFELLLLVKQLKENGVSDKNIAFEMKSLYKIKKSKEKSEFMTYEIEGKRENLYSENMVRNSLKSYYGRAAAIDRYEIDDLYAICDCFTDCFLRVRNGSNVDKKLMIDNVLMTTRKMLPIEQLKMLRRLPDDQWIFG